jgi:hypothetical protein
MLCHSAGECGMLSIASMDPSNQETPLAETTPDPLPAELAPFVAQARARLEQATDGLDHEAAVEHLEATVARAAIEASRLGFSFPSPDPAADPLQFGDGDGSIVVVQRLTGGDQPD